MISLESVLKYKAEFRGSFIDGTWRLSRRPSASWEAISPANLEWTLPSPSFSFEHVTEAVEAGRRAFKPWSRLGLHSRVVLVQRFGAELAKRADLIARTLSVETGKPLGESNSETDILQNKIASIIDHGLPLIKSHSLDVPGQGAGEIHYRPKGLLVIIGPFNLALSLPHGQIVASLLSGNTCLFKPSEKTPYSAQIYMEAAEAAGFPPGVLQLVQGRAEIGARLVRDTDVDGILATCSFDVGSHIQKELAEKPQRIVALQMGAKNAALVLGDANPKMTVDALINSAFMTSGQRCTALSRIYVQRSLMPEVVELFHERAKSLVVSHPFDEDPMPFMGPLISAAAKERFFRYTNIADGENAEVLMRAKSLEGRTKLARKPLPIGHYVSPSIHIVSKWDEKSAYQTHEVFGPDVFFCAVDSPEEAVSAANATGYGLACSVFGGSEDQFRSLSDDIEAGVVYWNRGTVGTSSRLPFGGWKKSGNHRPGGLFNILSTTQAQSRLKTMP